MFVLLFLLFRPQVLLCNRLSRRHRLTNSEPTCKRRETERLKNGHSFCAPRCLPAPKRPAGASLLEFLAVESKKEKKSHVVEIRRHLQWLNWKSNIQPNHLECSRLTSGFIYLTRRSSSSQFNATTSSTATTSIRKLDACQLANCYCIY